MTTTRNLQADWLGLAETHIDSNKPHVRSKVLTSFRSKFGFSVTNCSFSSSDIDYGSDWKPGGVFQTSVEILATRTIYSFSDKYGRFTAQTHAGQNGPRLTTSTAYQVIDGCKGPSSAFSQRRAMLVQDNRPATPRKLFIDDLIKFVQQSQETGSEILLSLDANETMDRRNSGIKRLTTTCGLTDIQKAQFPNQSIPSHQSGSTKIDYMFGSPLVLERVRRAGILSIDAGFCSNHRMLFIDLDIFTLFQGNSTDLPKPVIRSFNTKIPNVQTSSGALFLMNGNAEKSQLECRSSQNSPTYQPKKIRCP